MSFSAFNGQIAVREAALGRLRTYAKCRSIHAAALSWNGQEGSAAGVLSESSDASEWEARLGLPKWLAYTLDVLGGCLGSKGVAELIGILKAVPIGKNTETTGSPLAAKLLEEVVARSPVEGQMADALSMILELHQRSARGEDVEVTEWRRARQAAVRATDEIVPPPKHGEALDPRDAHKRGVGMIIEAGAWDPRRSPSAVSEVLRQWLTLEGMKANAEFGWHSEDDVLVQTRLGEMRAKYLANNPSDKRTALELIEIDHPDTANRMRAYIEHVREHDVVCAERACQLTRRLLESLT